MTHKDTQREAYLRDHPDHSSRDVWNAAWEEAQKEIEQIAKRLMFASGGPEPYEYEFQEAHDNALHNLLKYLKRGRDNRNTTDHDNQN